ncbi:uncharacterized protein LOC124204734 isoform X2 [Daphnia pulex]|uniref:uncharacterized protein LOC124204734 isoform X2 n=1 Tax=Daphnia pulex TaxID=6669 RepID=UPI001EDF80DE|nr:uncharacterized protein LOC124204734 isoform X2 [Daphnia pulex]
MSRVSNIYQPLDFGSIPVPTTRKGSPVVHWVNQKSDPEFLNCISKFKCLQFLEFSQCSDGDKIMIILGAHCTDLRELHVRDEVSDSGIRDLCVTGKCKSIHTLILTETNVTKLGIKMVLDNLPALRILQHPSTFEVLFQITNGDRYPLSDFFVLPNVPYTSYSMSGALGRCRKIRRLHIVKPKEFMASELRYFTVVLSGLVYFKISATPGEHPCFGKWFSRGIAHLLQDIGISLKSLSIANHYLIDIPWIIKYCPKLLSLTLEENGGFETCSGHFAPIIKTKQEQQTVFVLKKLKRLHFSGRIPEALLIILLSSFSLIYVCIENCDGLTDEVLEVTANLHQFQNLEHFEISFCNKITSKGIDCLMNERNPIEVMKLNHCHNLSSENIENWKKEKSEKNWKLSISGSVT